jgi:hypothetical protein
LDAVKDHLTPHLSEKKTAKEMFDALVGLFQSNNLKKKMILRNKLISVQMSRSENVPSYFKRITQVRDHLAAIGEKVDDVELINVALNGFPKSWESFVKGVYAPEKLPHWKRLWTSVSKKRLRRSLKSASREMKMERRT